MSLEALLSQTVTVLHRAADTEDEYGVPQLEQVSTTSVKARLEQTVSTEVTVGSSRILSDWVAYFLPTTTIDPYDRVVADGRTFEVVGAPAIQRSPRGPHHIEARLRFVQD